MNRLQGPFRLSQADIEGADEVSTLAHRCVTIENETTFHEIAKLRSGELLVHTSYPGSGTLALLQRLPLTLEFWHFGDSDSAGFDILRILREKSGPRVPIATYGTGTCSVGAGVSRTTYPAEVAILRLKNLFSYLTLSR